MTSTPETPRVTRILLVEDDVATRAGYTKYLTGSGYDVISASTGNDALTSAQTCAITIVVLDLGLPDIDGWEVARRLKASPTTAHLPIIALSGADLPHEVVSAMRAGCDRHLSKPCEPGALVDAIERSLTPSA